MVDSLEYLNVELLGCKGIECHAQCHESISEALDADSDRAVTHVGATGLGDRIIVDINDTIEVEGDDLGDIVKLLEIVLAGLGVDEARESDRGEITDGNFIG